MMRKKRVSAVCVVIALALLLTLLGGCGRSGGVSEPAASVPDAGPAGEQETEIETGIQDGDTLAVPGSLGEARITDDQALSAVRNYCFSSNPDLKSIADAGEYPVYWEVTSSTDTEIVVLFRSYTGAQVRYYIDPVSGETYVTESVPGVSSGEERTDEGFNVKDYFPNLASGASLSIPGTWQTASMNYEADGTIQSAYYVRFTDSEIVYGHLKEGEFVPDHSDKIIRIEETATGGYFVQAEASNGVRYTYQTCLSDTNVLEYYETWQEDDYSEMYRAGASLFRAD